jgi:hypothetical protein
VHACARAQYALAPLSFYVRAATPCCEAQLTHNKARTPSALPQCLHLITVTAVFDLSAVLWANIAGTQALTQASSDLDRFTMAHVAPQAGALWVHFVSVLLKSGVALALMYRVRVPKRAREVGDYAAHTTHLHSLTSPPPNVMSPPAVALDFDGAGPCGGGAAAQAGGAHRVCVRRARRRRCGCVGAAGGRDCTAARALTLTRAACFAACMLTRACAPAPLPLLLLLLLYAAVVPARDAFATLYPGAFVAAVPAVDPRAVTALAAERESLLHALEDARWALDHSKRISRDGVSLGRRPTHRSGACGLWGPRVDSLEAHAARLAVVEARLAGARAALLRGRPSEDAPARSAAFVTFATPRDAAVAAQVLLSRDPFTWRLAPAPPPEDVFWPNAGRLPPLLRSAVSYVTACATGALVVFYMIPIAAVSALSTLSNLSRLLPFLKPLVRPPAVRALLEGLLPGLALIIFMALLPSIIRALAASSGVRTRSGMDAAELRGMFLFAAINVFLGNVLAGSVFSGLKAMIDHPTGIVSLLGTTVPQTSRFFMAFIALKAMGGAASEVGCVTKCALYMLHTRLLGGRRTPRREAAVWAPHATALGSEVSDILLVALLSVIFSTIAPLMHCIAALYFFLRLGAVKANVLYRHEAGYEGAATLWASARARLGAALIIYQITLAGVFGLKRAPVQAALLLGAVMPATAAVMHALAERFNPALPGGAPPPLAWFARAEAASKEGDVDTIRVAADVDTMAYDDAAAAYLPPGLQPMAENDMPSLGMKHASSSESDLEGAVAGDVGAAAVVAPMLRRTRSESIIEATLQEEEEEHWHNASAA